MNRKAIIHKVHERKGIYWYDVELLAPADEEKQELGLFAEFELKRDD